MSNAGAGLVTDGPELQLGQTSDPAQLVHGDPAVIRASASRLRAFSSAFGRTADGLTGLDIDHWTGRAADAFRGKFAPHPARWREASAASGNAGGALESYADAVESARGTARRAIDMYAAGQQAEAEQVLGQARSSRDMAAARAETMIKTATDGARAEPSSWSLIGASVSHSVPIGRLVPDAALGACGALGAAGDSAASGLSDAAGDPGAGARSPSDIPQAGDPVDAATGDVLLFQDDVSLPVGSGVLPLVIGRAYRSSRRAGRWFGPGWASTFDQRLLLSPERVIGVFAEGRVLSWLCDAGGDGPVPATGLPVTGPRWRLERLRDGGFTVTDPQAGLTWRFERRPGYYLSAGGAGEIPLVSVTDRAGHQVSFSYTQAGQPAWITHSGGYRIRVVMSGGRFSRLVLASGREDGPEDGTEAAGPDGAGPEVSLVEYRYDPAGNLAAVINSSGEPARFSYDEQGRLLGWDDRNGVSYRYSYDEQGRCVAGTGPDGVMSGRLSYGNRVTWWTDAAGAVTIYQLDESSRVKAVTDPLGNVTHFWYDEYGRAVARADPLGRLTRYEHDEPGNITCITRPDGTQARAVYDDANLPVCLEEPDGASWTREHDARGNLVRRIAPDGAVTSYGYDARGHLASVTDPLGAVTWVESDPAGLPVAVTSPGGGVTRYTRDRFGRVTAITGPDGAVTELTWTVEGKLTSRIFPDGTSERLGYDAEGNLISRLSPAGEQASYEYGPFDLVSAATGPEGDRTEFRYDRGRRLTAVARGGLTWRYSYDAAGHLVAETDYNGARTEYFYDPAGQLASRVNAAGQQVACAYDELGRLVKRVADGVVTTFGYDAAGRLVLASNPDAEIRLSRDPLGRITAETCNDRTVMSEYDRAGRRSRRVTPGGWQQRWEYDDAGHPVLLDSGGQVLTFGYDRAGRETRRDLPGGLTLTQDWDMTGQLTSQILTVAPDGEQAAVPQVLSRRAYAYQADGFLAGVDDRLAGPRRFTLDRAGRTTSVKGPGWAERYAYDPAGNVSAARWIAPPPSAAGTWLAADVQGPRDRAGTLITRAGAVRYRHDGRGRVIGRQRSRTSREPDSWTYRWDADDRLTAVTTPDGGTWRYRYDPLGRRVAKQHLAPSGVLIEETTFTWDGALLAEEAAQRSTHHRRVTWDYQPGTCTALAQSESLSASGAPRQAIFYAIIADQLGTPAELVATDGVVAGHQQHTLWGGTLWHPGGASTPLRFPGQYHDPETGLHYNQQRYYDPVTGSYLTPDPLGLAPAPNPHTYVPNPHIQADPLGVMACAPRRSRMSYGVPDAEAMASWGVPDLEIISFRVGERDLVPMRWLNIDPPQDPGGLISKYSQLR